MPINSIVAMNLMSSSFLNIFFHSEFNRVIAFAKKIATEKIFSFIDTAVALNLVVACAFTGVGVFFQMAATGRVNELAAIALFLLTWQIYIVDRLVKNPEDSVDDQMADRRVVDDLPITHNDLGNRSAKVTQQAQQIIKPLVVLSVVVQAFCVVQQPQIVVGLIIGWLGGYSYVITLPVINCRIKQIPCAKTFYVPLVCVAMGIGTSAEWCWAAMHWDVLLSLWALVGINALVFDIKDRDRDFAAGIYTFFNLFSYEKVLHVAVGISSAIALLNMAISPDVVHRALSAAAVGTVLLLLPLYKTCSTRYLTHLFEWSIALPLLFFSFLQML